MIRCRGTVTLSIVRRFTSNQSVTSLESGEATKRGIQTPLERLKYFPHGVKLVYSDFLRYKNIHDASRTRFNAWTIASPLESSETTISSWLVYDDEARPGRIPRRQNEQQWRLIQEDLRTVLPAIALWAVPFIGTALVFGVLLFPRQALSRQFLNKSEIELFASIEYRQRRRHFMAKGDYYSISAMLDMKDYPTQGEDAAGPILDAMILFRAFRTGSPSVSAGRLAKLSSYPREYLLMFAQASGVNQSLPAWISNIVTELSLSWWLRSEILRRAKHVVNDDRLLLEEGYDLDGCSRLTDMEVLDACLIRGLPVVVVSYEEMRRCLTNHLRMIGDLSCQLSNEEQKSEGFKLFSVHLAPLRYHLKHIAKEK